MDMMELLSNPVVHEILKTSGPSSLLAMFGWVAWWYERKKNEEMTRRNFKMNAAQIQTNTRVEGALRALREIIKDKV